MNITKSNLTVDGNTVHVSMPFAKVDKEKRLVSGFATLDNIDSEGDIVDAQASAKAFARARGNIREMHQKIAVGRMVTFREDDFFDGEKIYRGIFVDAYVSKGAQDTWEKVLDGTLSGFSIGGEIKEATNEFSKEAGRSIRKILEYDLVELSLVDNPANPLANVSSVEKIFSMEKSADGSVKAEGYAADAPIENVFICRTDDDCIIVKAAETVACPVCDTSMENSGWIESGADRTEKVREVVQKFRELKGEAAPISLSEGGVEMDKGKNVPEAKETNIVNPSEEFSDGTKIEEAVGEEPANLPVEGDQAEGTDVNETGEDPEGAVAPVEVGDDAEEITKKINELSDAISASLEKNHSETTSAVAELEKKVDAAKKEFLDKASELEVKIEEFGTKLETQKSRYAELEKVLDRINRSEAVRKSADLDDEDVDTNVQKDLSWNGAFSGGARTSRFSIDNVT